MRSFLLFCILGACHMHRLTVDMSADVFANAQPSLKMESDVDFAGRALPGVLKTMEGMWVANPDNKILLGLLTEGYCQYGIGFVEDEWEAALLRGDVETAAARNETATRMFTRCLGYATKKLGSAWNKALTGTSDDVLRLTGKTTDRTPLMWAAIALASIVNHNKDRIDIVAQLPVAKAMLERVVALDQKHKPRDPMLAAMPYVALGMLYSEAGREFGGDADKAIALFDQAFELSGKRLLLARVLKAARVGKQTQNRELFRTVLNEVLATDPAIWPEERLANEIAHRRARRYLANEKEIF